MRARQNGDPTVVSAPVFSPAAGSYGPTTAVTITSATPGASIRYTTDGSTPTNAVGTAYTVPVSIAATATLKAIAYNGVLTDSSVTSGVFTINGAVATPTFSPVAGYYSTSQSVTISSATAGASFYYTTDGSTPTTGSTLYTGAITVPVDTTVKVLGVKTGYSNSSIASAAYTSALAGYDILLPYGQSNVFYSTTAKDTGIDIADADIYQWGYNAPNANTIIAGNDPLDYVDTSNKAGDAGNGGVGNTIGHAMTFARDTYKPTYANGRKIMLAGYAYGGQAVASGGILSANHVGAGYTSFISRALAAQTAGADSSDFKAIIFHQGEAEATSYGAAAQPAVMAGYRACLMYLIDKARTDLGVADLPFILGQMTEYSIDAGSARYSTNGININKIHRELVNRIEYTGISSNGGDGTGAVHFSAAEQRNMAARHATTFTNALANSRPACKWPAIDTPPAGFTVSNGDMDICGDATSAWKTAQANGGRRGELVYMEFEAVAVASQANMMCGLVNYFVDPTTYMAAATGNLSGAGSNSPKKAAAVWPSQANLVGGWTVDNAVSIGTVTAGDRIRIALNGSTGKAWIGKVGSAWPNSGDPAAGTNAWISGIGSTERVFPAVSINTAAGNKWRLHVNTGDFSGTVPTGFSAWGT